eukprot:4024153-Pleurochrysis_carterae.AAC.1
MLSTCPMFPAAEQTEKHSQRRIYNLYDAGKLCNKFIAALPRNAANSRPCHSVPSCRRIVGSYGPCLVVRSSPQRARHKF